MYKERANTFIDRIIKRYKFIPQKPLKLPIRLAIVYYPQLVD